MFNPVLIFASLFTALASTLLLGPLWGIVLGLMTFSAGLNVLMMKRSRECEAFLQRHLDELPELVRDLVVRNLERIAHPAPPAFSAVSPTALSPSGGREENAPAAPGVEGHRLSLPEESSCTLAHAPALSSAAKPNPVEYGVSVTAIAENALAPEIVRRLSVLDEKFDTILRLLADREEVPGPAAQSAEAEQDSPPMQTKVVPETSVALAATSPAVDMGAESLLALQGLASHLNLLLSQMMQRPNSPTESKSESPVSSQDMGNGLQPNNGTPSPMSSQVVRLEPRIK